MTDIIDFKNAKTLKDTDNDQTFVAPDGSRWFKYSITYEFDCNAGGVGLPEHILNNPAVVLPDIKQYLFNIWAQNEEEAKARLQAIKDKAEFGGQICAEIPV